MSEPNHNQVTFLAKQLLLQMVRGRTPSAKGGEVAVRVAWHMAQEFYRQKPGEKSS